METVTEGGTGEEVLGFNEEQNVSKIRNPRDADTGTTNGGVSKTIEATQTSEEGRTSPRDPDQQKYQTSSGLTSDNITINNPRKYEVTWCNKSERETNKEISAERLSDNDVQKNQYNASTESSMMTPTEQEISPSQVGRKGTKIGKVRYRRSQCPWLSAREKRSR